MAHSTRRSRRLKAEANQQLISFAVRGQQFAVPVGLVTKVTTVDQIYGGLEDDKPGLALYLDRQIPVINLGRRLFLTALPLLPEVTSSASQAPVLRYLLVVQSLTHELVGLLVETQPALIRVPTSAFAPVPTTYIESGNIRYIGAVINLKASPPIFLINIGELLQPQRPLLAQNEGAARALGPAHAGQSAPRLLTEVPPER
ncbi:MAG: chemotaxis protein CheW [Elainellaceae cyanobacterium]